ncbi:MAG: Ppx/GppA family phosphatase [Ignavibacteria bacterium]|nr:Ppx/GppA family phosphatase [Ignavibacteria bacterium]
MTKTQTLAAIDLGTNSFHLIIAQADKTTGRFKILGKDREIIRLGSGSTDMKYLTEQAMSRAVAALKRFRLVAESWNAEVHALATSAVREALNKDEFVRRVFAETDIKVEIASGAEEARLIHLGILQALPVFDKNLLMIDIGGGSTEFLFGKGRDAKFSASLKLGAVRLTERFFPAGSVTPKAVQECRAFVRGSLSPVSREAARQHIEVCAGSSGTIATLAGIIRVSKGIDPETSLNGFTFSASELHKTVNAILLHQNARKRSAIPGMEASRTDIIAAGAVLLDEIFRELNIKELTFSEYALREGIILDIIEKRHYKGKVEHLNNIRLNSVYNLADTFHYESAHAAKVAGLSLSIFDQTLKLHKLSSVEREYLEAAALLHEIGLFLSHSQHHRHSYYLIRNAELTGFTENEKEIIANIARYHRKSHPKLKHEGFGKLTEPDRLIVCKLSAILRIADGLDRSHASAVENVELFSSKNSVKFKLHLKPEHSPELELWGASRKKGLFEDIFKLRAEFIN